MNLQIICPLFLSVSVFAAQITPPAILEADLEISLFASEPDIVTPIGMAIDRQDRLYVVESHTHETKASYPGPKYDRVKIFQQSRGKPDKISIFVDDLHHAMNIAFSPEQKLYLVHRNGVIILHDRDGDGVSESRSTVLEMQTSGAYPHNGLDGIAFSPEGWLYVGLGENLGRPYTLQGTDGSQCSGGGEGGNIFRCRLDGTQLQRVATGFWNPFALAVDRAGNLFAVDNDPDGRPPCRLLHIVEHADYGYKFRYGRSGQHPFVAWEAELPGTLPMVAGTGEAPSGILDSARAALPSAYKDSFIVTAWGDNTLERYRLKSVGASFRATREIVVQGHKSFWPVSITADSNGVIYITDWADRDYSVHQKGRIWRLAAKPGVQVSTPEGATAHTKSAPALERMTQLLNAHSPGNYHELRRALTDVDPFIRSAAVSSLSQSVYRLNTLGDVNHEDPQVRLGVLLALRRAKYDQAVPLLREFISDPDEQVRRMALVWIGEDTLKELAKDIDRALGAGPLSPTLFSTYLATAEILTMAAPGSTQANPKDIWAAGSTRSQFIDRIIEDELKPINLRALAISMVSDLSDEKRLDVLIKVAQRNVLQLQIEAVRTLAESSQLKVISLLKNLAFNKNNPAHLRAEAIAGLARQPVDVLWPVIDLLDDPSEPVQMEAARALRMVATDGLVQKAFARRFEADRKAGLNSPVAEQIALALSPASAADQSATSQLKRPGFDAEWQAASASGGDSSTGRRIFFHPVASCSKCHRVQGRGGLAGPDLSFIARSSDRKKLIQSIVHPSQDIAPQFVQHIIEKKNGETEQGLVAGRGPDGSVELVTADAKTITIPREEILSERPSEVSLMPEGLEKMLTIHDVSDLVAFLQSLK